MRRTTTALIGVVVLLCAVAVLGQEGHPLTGTWSGDWGTGTAKRTHVTMVMAWDGKAVSGTINPGPDAIAVKAIDLNVTTWTVRFEAGGKDPAGAAVRIAAEGRIDDIGSYHRTISGTWQQGSMKGDFKLTRD
jgi:hypothetical protein